jgi:hypothetical protein
MTTRPRPHQLVLTIGALAAACSPAFAHDAHASALTTLWHVLSAPEHLPGWALLAGLVYLAARRMRAQIKAKRRDTR